MRINEITSTPFAKVKSVTPQGADATKSVVVLTTPDGKEIQTTQDNLIPGAQPNTFQLKSDMTATSNDGIKPGDTITQTPSLNAPTQTMGSEVKTSEDQKIGGDATDDFIDDVEDETSRIKHIKRLAGL